MTTDLTFIGTLPTDQFTPKQGGRPSNPMREQLRQNPGQWARIRSYPADRRQPARSYACYFRTGHSDIETDVRLVNGQSIVFARAIKVPTEHDTTE